MQLACPSLPPSPPATPSSFSSAATRPVEAVPGSHLQPRSAGVLAAPTRAPTHTRHSKRFHSPHLSSEFANRSLLCLLQCLVWRVRRSVRWPAGRMRVLLASVVRVGMRTVAQSAVGPAAAFGSRRAATCTHGHSLVCDGQERRSACMRPACDACTMRVRRRRCRAPERVRLPLTRELS